MDEETKRQLADFKIDVRNLQAAATRLEAATAAVAPRLEWIETIQDQHAIQIDDLRRSRWQFAGAFMIVVLLVAPIVGRAVQKMWP